MSKEQGAFWFHAKRFGWGWGLPATWQGWIVLVAYLSLVIGGQFIVPNTRCRLLYIAALTALLIVIVVLKGEKPLRWRWGKK